jgi:metallo-beta-lactamase family protein
MHTDHVGKVPLLFKNNFNGKVITVKDTKHIIKYMWEDSSNITGGVASLLNKYDDTDKFEPLYDNADIREAFNNTIELDFYNEYHLSDDMYLTYIPAGHIFKSGIVVIDFKTSHKRLVYTGDLGSDNIPYYFVEDRAEIPNANVVIAESTYSYKDAEEITPHDDRDDMMRKIKNTLRNNKTVLIPSFSLQRTPEILYFLYENLKDYYGEYEVFLDSPLSYKLFNRYRKSFSKLQELNHWDNFNVVKSAHKSEALCMTPDKPRIIVASSGMCVPYTRSSFHLQSILESSGSLLLKIGYAPISTDLGRVFNSNDKVKICDTDYDILCDKISYSSFSSHIQYDEMLDVYSKVKANNGFYLVHGNSNSKDAFANRLNEVASEENNTTKFYSVNRNDGIEF